MKKIIIKVGDNNEYIIGFSDSLYNFLQATQKDYIDLNEMSDKESSFLTTYHKQYNDRVHFKTEPIIINEISYLKDFNRI